MFVLIPVLIGVYIYVIYRKYYKTEEIETDEDGFEGDDESDDKSDDKNECIVNEECVVDGAVAECNVGGDDVKSEGDGEESKHDVMEVINNGVEDAINTINVINTINSINVTNVINAINAMDAVDTKEKSE